MALILNIDTSLEAAGLYLAKDGVVLKQAVNEKQSDHARWIHAAIEQLMAGSGLTLSQLDAIAVTAGPGSYTGLRVGMATAKGLCYALGKPLITESTLKVMAAAAYRSTDFSDCVCPMIDARRMEVFTAIYGPGLTEMMPPRAQILPSDIFLEVLDEKKCLFLGTGLKKWRSVCGLKNAYFYDEALDLSILTSLTYQKFLNGAYTNLAYAEPLYLKEFHVQHF
ncbi:MAG: tRNA ((37)-N6)-threonylcarbamoyltransferase complex dimerization subunit type 1 TsaB [Bacteroidota bacterium]|jgi:tRNA threonylcarbamoyladenosine biosynthesis protein TsaB